MKRLLGIMGSLWLVTSCATPDEHYYPVVDDRDHSYELEYESTFTNSEFYIVNRTEKDTIFKSKEKGKFNFTLKYNNFYHLQIRQIGPLQRDEYSTYIKLTDLTTNTVKDEIDTDECYVGWGYIFLVH